MQLLAALLLAALCVAEVSGTLNNRPVIAVLTQPLEDGSDKEILVASYVKWVESAGARVAPLRYTASAGEIKALLQQVNGLLLPGGLVSIEGTAFASAAQLAVQTAVALNAEQPFPLWGTCLGFEQLMAYLSSSPDNSTRVLSHVNAENVYLPLDWNSTALKASRLMDGATMDTVETLGNRNVTINMHEWGVLESTFHALDDLESTWRMLATSSVDGEAPFVALVEHLHLPVFGAQFHPEKNVFEFSQGHPDYVHTDSAIAAANFLARAFVERARLNHNAFESPAAEQAALIYNWSPEFTGTDEHVEQTYFF